MLLQFSSIVSLTLLIPIKADRLFVLQYFFALTIIKGKSLKVF